MGGFLGKVGGALKGAGHAVGDALNNKYVKMAGAGALAATGVGIPMSAAIMGGAGLAGGAMRHGGGLKGALTQGSQGLLQGTAAGLGGEALDHLGGIGTVTHKVGSALGKSGMAVGRGIGHTLGDGDGGLDLGKLAGIVGTYEGYKGNKAQRESAEAYNNSNIDDRNALMSQIMGGSTIQRPDVMGQANYGLPDISGMVTDAARPVQGPNITPAQLPPPSKKLAANNQL